jgi:broad specificity phosphatase PhoE
LSAIYLVRHGQAGLRDDYDTLSDLGRDQVRRLGEHLAQQGLRFAAFFSGGLKRQQQTAAVLQEGLTGAPPLIVDSRWSEFDLTDVYRGIAPQMAASDADFRREYEALQAASADPKALIHRQWTRTDVEVVRAWVQGRFQYDGESWQQFQDRVTGPLRDLCEFGPGEAVLISTSATPIGIWSSMAANGNKPADRQAMRLAGVLYNSSLTTIRLQDNEPGLFSFNNIPHLPAPELRTFR